MTIKHGTEWGWRACRVENGGTACEACRRAKQDAWKRQTSALYGQPVPDHLEHGEYVHRHYGCQCDICLAKTRAAKAERKRRERAARKEAAA